MQDKLDRIYVGWQSESYRADLLSPPKAPSNYKDPDKIREYVAKKTSERGSIAAVTPGCMRMTSITAYATDSTGLLTEVFRVQGDQKESSYNVEVEFIDFLCDRVRGFSPIGENVSEWTGGPADSPVAVIGARPFVVGLLYAQGVSTKNDRKFKLDTKLFDTDLRGIIFVDPYFILTQHANSGTPWLGDGEEVLSLENLRKLFLPNKNSFKFGAAELTYDLCNILGL